MGVYKRNGSPFWYYRFESGGVEFRGSTETASEREARAIEKRERKAAREKLNSAGHRGVPLTFGQACELYDSEVGQHHKGDGARNTAWSLLWLMAAIGAGRRLVEIDDALVARITAQRRGERGRHGQALAPATVNRSVVEPLRKVLMRARDVHKATVQPIKWSMHLLKEPKERVRELGADEEARVLDAVRGDYAPLVQFALITGMRLGECLKLTWADVNFGTRTIAIRSAKSGNDETIPMPPAVRDVLFPLQAHHPRHVFTYQARRTRDGRTAGERLPITASGVKSLWRRLRARIELAGYRWHDHRHTAATRILRAGGNLKHVQALLRHADIATTAKYAHMQADEIAAAMQRAAEANGTPPSAEAAVIVPMKREA